MARVNLTLFGRKEEVLELSTPDLRRLGTGNLAEVVGDWAGDWVGDWVVDCGGWDCCVCCVASYGCVRVACGNMGMDCCCLSVN